MNEADEEAQMVRLQEIVEKELEKGTIEDLAEHISTTISALLVIAMSL